MAWLADAHRDWHTVNGWDVVCPLDCGVTEGLMDEYEQDHADEVQVYREDIEAHVTLFEPAWYDEPFPDWQD